MAEQRYEAVLAVIEDGLSVTDCGACGMGCGNELIRTVVRDNERCIRKKRASKPAQT